MPYIPRKQKKRAYQPPKRKFQRRHDDSKFYATPRWRKTRKVYLNRHPFCQICLWQNKVSEAKALDHLIRVQSGGAKFDIRNLMGMCERHHNIKSGKETHNPILIDYTRNDDGDMIPKNREDIMKIYEKGGG
ncbi:MAG: HNH endonuclease signature motif containing protein [Bacteroidota bacterium]